ncbi:MAG: ribosome biogenesis GTPase YlqF [Thiotrichaceae bacterium]|nr:ribosome biogenesis GTPase YlqF [Thiotrichaceae bacterium]
MQIQWYPGHMYKASLAFKETLPSVDLIIEILDARIPYSSENPMVADLRGDKPCIKVLNKSDLGDETLIEEWQDYWQHEDNVRSLAVNMNEPDKIKQIVSLCKKMLPEKAIKDRPIHAMIMGIPNVGKSTIINILAGRKVAKTGNEPAVTKRQQRIDLDNGVVLLDTPGVLWPNIENEHSGYRLAATGAIKDTALDYPDVAFYVIEYLLEQYPERLKQRYQLDSLPSEEYDFFQQIGQSRGCLRGGGDVDLEKISKILIAELRSGLLGGVTFETPKMMKVEKALVEVKRAKKLAKEATRKNKNKRKVRR